MSSLVAAVGDSVVDAPVSISIGIRKVVRQIVTWLIISHCLACTPRLVFVSSAVPARGAPSEEVYPAVVGLGDVGVVGTGHIVLTEGEAPFVLGGVVLEVATGEVDFLGVGDGEGLIGATDEVESAGTIPVVVLREGAGCEEEKCEEKGEGEVFHGDWDFAVCEMQRYEKKSKMEEVRCKKLIIVW